MMLKIKQVLAKILGAFQDAYITRTYTVGGVNQWYANNDINIAVSGYTPISVSGSTNQATVHFFKLEWTDTILSVGRSMPNSTTTLSNNTGTFKVRYIKNELIGRGG